MSLEWGVAGWLTALVMLVVAVLVDEARARMTVRARSLAQSVAFHQEQADKWFGRAIRAGWGVRAGNVEEGIAREDG